MSGQPSSTAPGATAATPENPARATTISLDARAADSSSPQSSPGDIHADPALEGIPREVVENVGVYDTDTAGGCG